MYVKEDITCVGVGIITMVYYQGTIPCNLNFSFYFIENFLFILFINFSSLLKQYNLNNIIISLKYNERAKLLPYIGP